MESHGDHEIELATCTNMAVVVIDVDDETEPVVSTAPSLLPSVFVNKSILGDIDSGKIVNIYKRSNNVNTSEHWKT